MHTESPDPLRHSFRIAVALTVIAVAIAPINFLVYVGEPAANSRKAIGIVVLFILLGVLFPLTYWLKKEFWKDVK